jgi:ketosteroid isomerase-like protein
MKTVLGCVSFFATGLVAAQSSSSHPAAVLAPMSADECAVWARETSFAQSVDGHDLQAFAEHVHPGGVFIGGNGPLRGRAEIVKAWQGIVEASGPVSLHWYPAHVAIGAGDADTAVSTGPVWFIDKRPGARNRYLRGNFVSTWKRDESGTWHVLYDAGSDPEPVSEIQFEAGKTGIVPACPPASAICACVGPGVALLCASQRIHAGSRCHDCPRHRKETDAFAYLIPSCAACTEVPFFQDEAATAARSLP